MLFCKVSFVYVCLYVFYAAIYFRVWLCGCGYVGVVVRMSEFFLDPPLLSFIIALSFKELSKRALS